MSTDEFVADFCQGQDPGLSLGGSVVERYREFADFLPQPIFEINVHGRILFANKAFCSTFLYTSKDLECGLNILDMHISEDAERLQARISNLLQGGPTGHEYTGRRKDGSTFPLVAHSSLILREDGQLGLRGMLIDLSRQKQVEVRLRASEERYRAVFENTGNAAVIVEEDWSITLANSQWRKLTGRLESDCPGNFLDYVHPEDRERLEAYHRGRLMGDEGVPNSYEVRIVNALGEARQVINHMGLIPGTTTSFGSMLDISDLRRSETERDQLQDRLRQSEKLEAIGQLAGGVAHDFNNHLSAILGFAEMLMAREERPEELHFLRNIVTSCEHAGNLTRQLLAFARKGKYLSVPVDVNDVIQELVLLLRHSIDRRIQIETRLEAPCSFIQGDPTQIQNALMNLALNARDAMTEGGRLTFSTGLVFLDDDYCSRIPYTLAPGTYLRVSVEDSGMGMDPETQARIFEPFFTTKEVGKGTGLGLASVYGTVKQHGGSINVYSELQRGSCFKIYLPLANLDEGPAPEPELSYAGGCSRILLVEDENLVAEMATSILQDLGHCVNLCSDGLEAVERYQTAWEEFDLVILDMIMPQLGGAETFRLLRDINPDAKIILSSGFSLEGEAQALLDSGALAFLQKPFHKSELAQAVEKALRKA